MTDKKIDKIGESASPQADDQIPEPDRPQLTPLSAHPALQAASDYAGKCAAVERERFGTRAYYAAMTECDEAWERIAAALAAASPAPTRPLPLPVDLEVIAQEWDECHVDAPGGEIEVGPALREQFRSLYASLPPAEPVRMLTDEETTAAINEARAAVAFGEYAPPAQFLIRKFMEVNAGRSIPAPTEKTK